MIGNQFLEVPLRKLLTMALKYDTLYISHNNRNRFTFVKRRNYTGRKHAIPALRLKPYTIHLYRQHPGSAFGWTIPTKHHSKQQKLF